MRTVRDFVHGPPEYSRVHNRVSLVHRNDPSGHLHSTDALRLSVTRASLVRRLSRQFAFTTLFPGWTQARPGLMRTGPV
jgi:hypothetical protein